MGTVVRYGYIENGTRVELRVHVYHPSDDLKIPYWSVKRYRDTEGKSSFQEAYFQKFEDANIRFLRGRNSWPEELLQFTVGANCENHSCRNYEALVDTK